LPSSVVSVRVVEFLVCCLIGVVCGSGRIRVVEVWGFSSFRGKGSGVA
jgi:hypothetical protein